MLTRKQRKNIQIKIWRFLKFRVLHVDDSTHRIALGIALGMFVGYTPPLGHHILMVIFLCSFINANKFTALTFIWVSNPLTYVFLYYPNYLLGRSVLAFFRSGEKLGASQITEMFERYLSFGHVIGNFYKSEFWSELGLFFAEIGFEMFIGGLIIGCIVAVVSYIISYRLIDGYRRRHPHHFPDHI